MTITRLIPRRVAKPWGRTDIGPLFDAGGERIGEIWFELPAGADEPALLVKYLFTSEKLSVQVHPDDAQAQQVGARQGKEEAWVIMDADPGAVLGLGLTHAVSRDTLQGAALDGSIEALIDWRTVAPGQHFHVTPGTIHAIGGGLTLVEVQQYADITYRLYDYGRPRELHLEQSLDCARRAPYAADNRRDALADGVTRLVPGPKFCLIELDAPDFAALAVPDADGPLWFIPLAGAGQIGGQAWQPGECWMLDAAQAEAALTGGGRALVAWALAA